jgi:hypothetical protein
MAAAVNYFEIGSPDPAGASSQNQYALTRTNIG